MADRPNEDELQPEQTEGFKVGEKKTIDEYQKLGTLSSIQIGQDPSIACPHALRCRLVYA